MQTNYDQRLHINTMLVSKLYRISIEIQITAQLTIFIFQISILLSQTIRMKNIIRIGKLKTSSSHYLP